MARSFSPFSARRGTVGLIVVIGLILSFLVWHHAVKQDRERIKTEFFRRAQAQASLAHERLLIYEEMVYSLRGAFVGQNEVSRKEFARVSQELLLRHTGVQALEWVQIVKDDERAALEAKASLELGKPFVFKRRMPTHEFIVAPQADEYLIITYVEPLAGNDPALGYDLTSAPSAGALVAARTEKKFKVSQSFQLAQSTNPKDEAGVSFVLPIFKTSVETSPVKGFVQGIFRIQTMLSQAHHIGSNEGLHSYYLDEGVPPSSSPILLYANLAGLEPMRNGQTLPLPPLDVREDFRDTIQIGDRHWTLLVAMDPTWAIRQQTSQPALMLVAGTVITVLLALFINALLQRTGRVERAVAIRTAQLRETEARFQSILDHSPALIFVKDLAGGYLLFNKPFSRLCGRADHDIKGRTDQELFPAEQAESYIAHDRQVLAAGRPMEFEEVGILDGEKFTCIVQKFPLLNSEGQPFALCGIATDITARKQAELELQEKRRQLSNLISQLPGSAFRCLFDENLTALFASEGMLSLTGYPAEDFTAGRIHIAALTVPVDKLAVRTAVATALAERRNFEIEYRIAHRDGQEKWVLVRGRPIYDTDGTMRFIEGLAIDITALKHAEAEKIAFERNIQETQKLESLGVLAGGIAHDFNNLLTAILGNASLMRYTLLKEDTSHAQLEQIEKAARRAADLCSQMLAYAGKGKLSSGPIDLSLLVRDTTSLIEVYIGKNCELCLQLAGSLPPVLGDATQLRQIVMNLVINGSDAIGERAGGKISVTTFARQADAALFRTAIHQPKLEPGLYVGLEVKDNGCGMPPETIARIFEPFFTTKFSGRGLGLSAVLGIVQSHHGALFLESLPNQGSTFRLLLPAASGASIEDASVKSRSPFIALRGTVLVTDDEEAVRLMLGRVLRQHGATVLLAANGTEALEIYQTQRDRIDVILLDLTMPGLSGEEILLRLQRLKARQKIIIMSGYGEEETMQRCAELGAVGFISKPFELQAVVTKLQSLLS